MVNVPAAVIVAGSIVLLNVADMLLVRATGEAGLVPVTVGKVVSAIGPVVKLQT